MEKYIKFIGAHINISIYIYIKIIQDLNTKRGLSTLSTLAEAKNWAFQMRRMIQEDLTLLSGAGYISRHLEEASVHHPRNLSSPLGEFRWWDYDGINMIEYLNISKFSKYF